jgi:hypothetical protein
MPRLDDIWKQSWLAVQRIQGLGVGNNLEVSHGLQRIFRSNLRRRWRPCLAPDNTVFSLYVRCWV